MSKADEFKAKNENLFERNTILLNENERLKKENAELKKRVDNLYNSDCWASDQLTKAKEIIREIMKYEIPTLDYVKAEQFLKEIEK